MPPARAARRPPTAFALGLAACLLAAGCGSGAQVATTTTTLPDPLAASLVSPADEIPDLPDAALADALTARSAALAATDFPAQWAEALEGGVGATGPGACSSPVDDDGTPLGGIAFRGPTMQPGDAPAHVSSAAHVFADEATARGWIDVVRSEEWVACRERSLDAALAERDTGIRVDDVGEREHPQLGTNGFEAFTELRGVDPDDDLTFVVHVLHHRRGRVVLESTLERSIELSDAQWAAVDDAHASALATAWARLSAMDP